MDNQRKSQNGDVDRMLKDWSVDAELPEGFSNKVWNRIASEESQLSPAAALKQLLQAAESLLRMPAFAAAFVAVFLVVGGGIGWLHADQKNAEYHQGLGMKYVQTIDPYHLHKE